MNGHLIEVEFEAWGTRRGRALLLSGKDALALIDRAAHLGVPIRAIDQVRPDQLDGYLTIRGSHGRDEGDPWGSWDRARQFVHALSGRGLLFEVVLEDGPGTPLVRRTGYLTHSDTRALLVAGIVILGLVATVVMFWAGTHG